MLIVFRSHNVDQNPLRPFLLTVSSVQYIFTLLYILGYSAYASHFLICVTMKEKKLNAKKCWKGGIDPPRSSINCWKTELNRIWKMCVKVVVWKNIFLYVKNSVRERPMLRVMSSKVEKIVLVSCIGKSSTIWEMSSLPLVLWKKN